MNRRIPLYIPLTLLIVALVAYYLPWWWGRAAALSANAYDFAEWTTPAVAYANPPLLPPFFLRSALVGLSLLFGLYALHARGQMLRIVAGIGAILLAITLFPPPEFFLKFQWADSNYREQFLLALGTLIALGAAYFLRKRPLPWQAIQSGLSLVVIGCAIAGEVLALNIVRALQLEPIVGMGVILFIACVLAYGVIVLITRRV